MIVKVIKATYINNFIIKFSLKIIENKRSNQIDKVINLEDYIKSKKDNGIFAPLKDIKYFKNFSLSSNTIEWNNGADIAPERFLELKKIREQI